MPRKEDSVPATLRAVSVLEALVAADRPAALAELTGAVRLRKPTLYPMLGMLEAAMDPRAHGDPAAPEAEVEQRLYGALGFLDEITTSEPEVGGTVRDELRDVARIHEQRIPLGFGIWALGLGL